MSYSDKFKNPKWQRRRLEVLNRDNFTCLRCLSKDKTLHVHHNYYTYNTDLWEYPDECYMTLCEECHTEITKYSKAFDEYIKRKVFCGTQSDPHTKFQLCYVLTEYELASLIEELYNLIDKKSMDNNPKFKEIDSIYESTIDPRMLPAYHSRRNA